MQRPPRRSTGSSHFYSTIGDWISPREVLLGVGLGALVSAPSALGEGFRSPTTGTAGLGTTGGRMVFIDDSSAVFHNPANLLELQDWEAAAEPTIVYHAVTYESPSGATASTEDPWKLLPHFFAGGPIGDGRVALGLGLSVPFGLSVDWGQGGALRYVAPRYVQLKTLNANPSAAFCLAEGLTLGVGLDIMWSELTLSQFVPWSLFAGVPGLPDGDLRIQGKGIGFSGNAGLTWEFLPRQRLALTVRAPMDVDYDGDVRVTNVPGVAGGDALVSFDSRIQFPTIVGFGYGIRLHEGVRLEANMEWLQFSRFDTLPLRLGSPIPGVPGEVRQDWNDTFTFGGSATWDIGSGWRLRASYEYFQTPVPEETYSPSIPDAAQHAVAVGAGYRHGRHRFDVAYSRVFYEDRDIAKNQNPYYLGKYEVEVHLISAAYGFSF